MQSNNGVTWQMHSSDGALSCFVDLRLLASVSECVGRTRTSFSRSRTRMVDAEQQWCDLADALLRRCVVVFCGPPIARFSFGVRRPYAHVVLQIKNKNGGCRATMV